MASDFTAPKSDKYKGIQKVQAAYTKVLSA